MPVTIDQWASTAAGRRMQHNAIRTLDCTDVPNDLIRAITGTDTHIYGHGADVAANAGATGFFRVEPFIAGKAYPKGTVFSATVPGSAYGHTGVLSHRQSGKWFAFQQDTFRDVACWLGPVVVPIHTVAIPLVETASAPKPTAPAGPTPTPNQSEEDDMPITDAEIDRIANRVFTAKLSTNWGSLTLPELVMEAATQASERTLTRVMSTNVGAQSLADLVVSSRQRLDELTDKEA